MLFRSGKRHFTLGPTQLGHITDVMWNGWGLSLMCDDIGEVGCDRIAW